MIELVKHSFNILCSSVQFIYVMFVHSFAFKDHHCDSVALLEGFKVQQAVFWRILVTPRFMFTKLHEKPKPPVYIIHSVLEMDTDLGLGCLVLSAGALTHLV